MTSDTTQDTNIDIPKHNEVRAFLERNRNFFVLKENQKLLEHLTIPHNCGRSISLLEYQVQLFRQQRDNAFAQLDQLIEIHRFNQKVASVFYQLVQDMVQAQTTAGLIATFSRYWKKTLNVDFVGLYISDTGLQQNFNYKGNRMYVFDHSTIQFPPKIQKAMDENKIICGIISPQVRTSFGSRVNTGSYVALPSGQAGKDTTYGYIFLASKDKARFTPDMQTHMIRFVCNMFFICLISRSIAGSELRKHKSY